jgi:hypothetical protein
MAEKITCTTHGTQDRTVVCQHIIQSLRTGQKCGFYCAETIEPGFTREDAWCADCEEKRTANGGEWPEDCGSFLGLKVLCVACYDLAKLFNLSNKTLDECRH